MFLHDNIKNYVVTLHQTIWWWVHEHSSDTSITYLYVMNNNVDMMISAVIEIWNMVSFDTFLFYLFFFHYYF